MVLNILSAMEKCTFIYFNVNGCRQSFKRAQLFDFLKQKRAGVVMVQETHTEQGEEAVWLSEWGGQGVFSHGSSTSAGVAVLFKSNLPVSVQHVEEIEKGRLLKVQTQIAGFNFTFINIYAPNTGRDRILLFNKLKQTILKCNNNDVLVVAGDFNCTIDFTKDRNTEEPHPQSSRELTAVLQSSDLVDVWRCLHPQARQYTWSQSRNNYTSRARLDQFYSFRCHLNFFVGASIIPNSLSDHHCLLVSVLIPTEGHKSSYWHFNIQLLKDCKFGNIFKEFWKIWQKQKNNYQDLRQWWDIGKKQIKFFCQQYTLEATRSLDKAVRELERDILNLENNEDHSNEQTFQKIKEKRHVLGSLLEEKVKGALVRSRFVELRDMDAPTSFFFGLEKKRACSQQLRCVRTPCGRELHSREEISEAAVQFYKQLFTKELCDPDDTETLLQDLPSLSEEEQRGLDTELTFEELTTAMTQLSSRKVPGIDGLPAEFFKHFWAVIGEDFFQVLKESLERKELPLSCRRAVITLLPKKGDLCLLKNWRPVSLLCADSKIISRCLANRLKKCLSTVIHKDQSYCIPGRSIFDNLFLIRDFLTLSETCHFNVGLVSLDQEKAFDRVDHTYLVKVLRAFGFGPVFISFIELLYANVFSVLKINNGLSKPFSVSRGIRQGCSLYGMLYSLTKEPLLHLLRGRLSGWAVPASPVPVSVKVSAYADDVNVFVCSDGDVQALKESLAVFQRASSARINCAKCNTFLSGGWQEGGPPCCLRPCSGTGLGLRCWGCSLGQTCSCRRTGRAWWIR